MSIAPPERIQGIGDDTPGTDAPGPEWTPPEGVPGGGEGQPEPQPGDPLPTVEVM